MSDLRQELVPLSPSMFLQDIREVGVCDLDEIDETMFKKRLEYRTQIRNALRQRFRTEYLGSLIHRKTKDKICREVNVGDIVLVELDNNTRRINWSLARVEQLIYGVDKHVRVVRLRTASGELTRPLQKMFPLELRFDKRDKQINHIITEKIPINSSVKNGVKETLPDINKVQVTRSGRKVKAPEIMTYS